MKLNFGSWCHPIHIILSIMAVFASVNNSIYAQEIPTEEDFFKIESIKSPQGIILEVGGLAVLPTGDLGVATRRGDIFVVENPTSNRPYFRKFASGLHEPLGLSYKDGAFYCTQRGELTKLVDTDNDGKADVVETIYSLPLSGNYHEYSYGPAIAPDGDFFVTTNVGFFRGESWRGKSKVPWRGWALKISENGNMEPWATGMRSPAGLGIIDGELFYTDNQGDWIGSGGLWPVVKGDFMGNPAGLNWTGLPGSPLDLTMEQFHSKMDPRRVPDGEGGYLRPQNIVDEDFVTLADMKKEIPELRLPAVWLPYGFLGISTSQPISIPEGVFGPFEGQVLVGDQGMSIISRVFLEKVNGEHQGASFAFRSGFNSGVLRMAWAENGSLFVGETNRGWGSAGEATEGLERLVWNGIVPFEMKAVRAMPDGFEIEFTKPVDRKSADDLASYSVESFSYKYQPVYGSPPVNSEKNKVVGVKLSEDGRKARIVVDNLRQYYIHKITLNGVRERNHNYPLVHSTAYYTLNNIPKGKKLSLSNISTRNSALTAGSSGTTSSGEEDIITQDSTAKQGRETPGFFDVKGLLVNYTCFSCHHTQRRQIGPSFLEISSREYSNEKIKELIHNPQPENWPDYETAMPPMPQVSEADALKIAAFINSLRNYE